MSLLDAPLLDPPRIDVWVILRAFAVIPNNTKPSGELIQGELLGPLGATTQQQELTTLVDDALMLSFL